MKHLSLLAFGLILFVQSALSQSNYVSYTGNWQGAIEIPGMNLELSIHLQQEGPAWKGYLSIPVQKIKDMVLAELVISGREISFTLPEVPGNASFKGSFDEKSEHVAGKFTQSGQTFPMNLTRTSAAEKAAEEKRLSETVAAFLHLIDSLQAKRHTPGLAVGIIKDGKILMNEGFGYRDLDRKLPVTTNTLFAIGSSSKAFTATGLAMLVDRGELEWSKPVVTYIPEFKLYDEYATREINATDLCCHRSGLPRHDFIWYGASLNRQQIFNRLRYLKPNKSLRTDWQYNNLMFMTAGYLIEHISGKTWESFTQENIMLPLGMKNSNFSVIDMAKSKDASLGYVTKKDKNIRVDYRNIDAMGPAGSINSTSTDMLQWLKFHLGDGKFNDKKLLSSEQITFLHTPQMLMDGSGGNVEIKDPSYALGWMTYRHRGLKVVEHGGNIDGFSALVYMVPEKDFGIVILTNQGYAGLPAILARYATDMILNLESTDWYGRSYAHEGEAEKDGKEDKKPEPRRVANTLPAHPLADYAGEYDHPGYGRIEISEADKGLRFKFNSFDLPMEHWHYDVFRTKDTVMEMSLMINFRSDVNGSIEKLSVAMDRALPDEEFSKVAPARLSDPVFLQKMTGKYTMEQLGDNSCSFELRNNTLFAKVPGQPEYTLVPFQGMEFKLKELNGYSIEFVMDEKGEIGYANFIQVEGVFKAKKVK